MIITEQKSKEEILAALKDYARVFIVGCAECASTCKTGGEEEVKKIKAELEKEGKQVSGYAVPSAPCLSPSVKKELVKNINALKNSDVILVLACGLGTQSVKDNDRFGLAVIPGCNSLFGATMDAKGNFYEKCSLCAECVLDITGGICPITLCSKGLLNGPCGGVDKGKCEVDKERDCAWVLIYKELEKKGRLGKLKELKEPRNFKKATRPHKLIMSK